jgi:hypothetical protein
MCAVVIKEQFSEPVNRAHLRKVFTVSWCGIGGRFETRLQPRRDIPALAVAVAAIDAQVTVNDLVIARYTADAWRSAFMQCAISSPSWSQAPQYP